MYSPLPFAALSRAMASELKNTPTGSAPATQWRKGLLRVLGVLFAVIIGPLLVWAATRDGGPLNPRTPPARLAKLQVLSIGASVQHVGQVPQAQIQVRNDGAGSASDCYVNWFPLSNNPRFIAGTRDWFGLGPGEEKTVPVVGLKVWARGGMATGEVRVYCDRVATPVVTHASKVFVGA
jgi:hypothetical protein